jgi:hypothetical protein
MDVDTGFWSDSRYWPPDEQGYVFLASAVQMLGKFWFRDNWTGREPTLCEIKPLAPYPATNYAEHIRAQELLIKFHPESALSPTEKPSLNPESNVRIVPLSLPGFTAVEWESLQILIRQHNEAPDRFDRVAFAIATLCRTGRLEMGLRPVEGGLVAGNQPISIWQTEGWHSRFHRCRMNPNKPFSSAIDGKDYQYIFLTRTSLDSCMGAAQRGKIKKKRGANESNDDKLQEQLRKLQMLATREKILPIKGGEIRTRSTELHRLGKSIGMTLSPEAIRKILADDYGPANRLVIQRGIEAWWRSSDDTGGL